MPTAGLLYLGSQKLFLTKKLFFQNFDKINNVHSLTHMLARSLSLSLFSMPCSFPMGMKRNSGILLVKKRETNLWDALESESATERETLIYDKNTGTICSYEKELMGLLLSK